MSGISGIWHLNGRPVEKAVLSRLSETLAHRGPDDDGLWIHGPVGLACRLLRVTPEASAEIQPLVAPSGAVIVFDGRLDNREDLLAALKASSGISATSPDPALVLAAYDAFGDQFPERLDGDFAFGLFDPSRRQLLLARDALGVRPLYYYCTPDLFLFASEIKALLAHPQMSTRPNDDHLAQLLVNGAAWDNEGFTFFTGVSTLLPAHQAVVTSQGCLTRRYWDFDPSRRIRLGSFEEYAEAFRHHFDQAVRRRLHSAYPVAVTVSGGLDSSSIFCTAQTIRRRDPLRHPPIIGISQTFTDGSPSDEKAFLQEIERAYGIVIERVPMHLTGPLNGVREEVWHVEAPLLDEQWENTCTIRQTIRQLGARVLLTGQWGDNILVDQAYLIDLFRSLAWGTICAHLREFCRWNSDVNPASFRQRFFRDLVRYHVPEAFLPILRRLRAKLVQGTDARSWYTEPFQSRVQRYSIKQTLIRGPFATAHARSLYREARSRYNVLSMEWNNKASAMHGFEIAFPFLDRDLVSFLMGIPGQVQSWKGVTKGILRESMRGVLPDAIVERRWKADFTDLVNNGMERDYPELVRHLQADGMAIRLGYVRGDVGEELARLKERIRGPDCLVTWSLSGLLGLAMWLQVFFGEAVNRKELLHASPR